MENIQTSNTETQNLRSQHSQPPKTTKPKSRLRWLWYGLCILLVFVVVLLAFLATGKGQRSAIMWLDQRLDFINIGRVEGSLQQGLSLEQTQFQMDGITSHIGKLDLHIDFACVLKGQACIEDVVIDDTQIIVETSKLPPPTPKKNQKQGEFNLPLGISLNNISVNNLQLRLDETEVSLNHFHTGLEAEGKSLKLAPTLLDGLILVLPAPAPQSNSIAKEAVYSQEKNASQTAVPSQNIDWATLKTRLSQPLLNKSQDLRMPVSLDMSDVQARNIAIKQRQMPKTNVVLETTALSEIAKSPEVSELLAITDFRVQGKITPEEVRLTQLELLTDKGRLIGSGVQNLAGNAPLDWQIHLDTEAIPKWQLPKTQINLHLEGELFQQTKLNTTLTGIAEAKLNGTIQLAKPKTPFDLQLKLDHARYSVEPKKDDNVFEIKNAAVELSGDLLNYRVVAEADMVGRPILQGKSQNKVELSNNVELQGEGQLTQFELKHLNLATLEGKASLQGKIDWSNGITWQNNLTLDNIHTKNLLPNWAAQFSGELVSKGHIKQENTQDGKEHTTWIIGVSTLNVDGNIEGRKLNLNGHFNAGNTVKDRLLNVPQLVLTFGDNRIQLNGTLGKESNLAMKIDAPQLAGLYPDLTVTAKGNIQVKGNITEPNINLDLMAKNITYQQVKLRDLTTKGEITTQEQIQGNLDVLLGQLSLGEMNWQNIQLAVTGNDQSHQLSIKSAGDPVAMDLQLAGHFDRNTQKWQGQLSNANIKSVLGIWKNNHTIQIDYDHLQTQAKIAHHCWLNPQLNLCFPKTLQLGKQGDIPFEVKQFNLALFKSLLDKNSQLAGKMNINGDIQWFEDKKPTANVLFESPEIKFSQKVEGRNFPIHLFPVKIQANLANDNLRLATNIRFKDNGRIHSDLEINDIINQKVLSGHLGLEQLNLKMLSPLLNNGDHLDGELNAVLKLGGILTQPLLYGDLDLTGLKVKIFPMPFNVSDGHLGLHFNGATSQLQGGIQSESGQILLEGDANWKKLDNWHTRIRAKGDGFRINIPNMVEADISPNVEVKATPNLLEISGNVDIPKARIAIESLPESAVAVSADEVILDRTAKPKVLNLAKSLVNSKHSSNGMGINADVSINIGNDVKLKAYGLNTNLQGVLKVHQGNRGLGLYGQVNLLNGTFASFGQDLIINKGLISFTGLPSQPTLDIEAIRNPDAMEDSNITAGLKITGIADSPDVKIFSNPSMSQDQALSYILTGRSLDGGDTNSQNSIAAALIGLSLSKGSQLVGGVGSVFGINDLNVTTAGIGDNTKVVVSGSLTPRFKVEYGVGLFAPLTELTLRYRLAPSLYLQWISSINQAVDLIYRFEFD
ncbi:autotransporter secretion inner membrane protein TamB [Nicoletella semolina]|uniref:Autotransporter secretion inner membrane protein TamB n=1 Tax=Nicoletella semolina TaxID=271160 RepID=A0A4R2N9C1_9PAST|nr:translocation/assembly module TamB domain-containing protein [Nicoletella semolina]MDH2925518.1 hypothetical protein [Nicoletella semolina]TCP17593.1 autotransporter secretion inner membrane protein TamB [Nicoletella semolina]